MKAKTLRIVLPMLTAIMILGGCGQTNTTQQDILNMLNTSDTITIQLSTEDTEDGTQYKVDWIQLGDMTSSKELRAVMDEQFRITGNTGNKNGMFYVNEKGENTQNNTLSVALRNRAFTTILNNADDLESINYTLAGNYSDIDIEDERAIYAAISDYFELLNAGENGESNIEDSLSRAEAMSLVFRAVTPVSEIEGNSAFDSAVGENDYNAFANQEDKNVFVSTSDGSLNETTYIQNMTKAEYIYLVMNEVFGNQAVQSVDASTKIDDLANAGDLRADEKLGGKQQLSSAIIKEFVNNPSKIDESLYKAIVLANEKGISNTDNMDSAITKGEAVEILCKALMQNTSIEEFNYNMGSVNTDYEYAEPESVEAIESTEAELSEEEIAYINSDDYNTAEEVTEPVNEQPEQTVADYEVEQMTATMYATQSVNVRQEPTVDSSKVGSKSYAEAVEVTGKVTSYKGESCLWYQTSDGTFVSGNYLTETKPTVTTNATSTGNTNNSNSTSTPSNNNSSNNSNNNGTAQGGISQDVWDAFFSDNGGQSTDGGQASLGDSSYGGGAHIN